MPPSVPLMGSMQGSQGRHGLGSSPCPLHASRGQALFEHSFTGSFHDPGTDGQAHPGITGIIHACLLVMEIVDMSAGLGRIPCRFLGASGQSL